MHIGGGAPVVSVVDVPVPGSPVVPSPVVVDVVDGSAVVVAVAAPVEGSAVVPAESVAPESVPAESVPAELVVGVPVPPVGCPLVVITPTVASVPIDACEGLVDSPSVPSSEHADSTGETRHAATRPTV